MATASNIRIRLPGVYFLPPPRAGGLGLPPLDVAAFVGFAERGPLHTPVAVEDLNAYRAVFGGDLELARDLGGRTVYAHLPTAVATFFSNGGRRCYVVRIAGNLATTTRFRVPGMVALNASPSGASFTAQVVPLRASSEGRWSGRLRLGARLHSTPLPVAAFQEVGARQLSWQTGSAPEAIQPGDLLRLAFNDERQWLFPVTQVEQVSGTTFPKTLLLTAQQVWQLASAEQTSPARRVVQQARRLTFGGAEPLAIGGTLWASQETLELAKNTLELALTGAQAGAVKRGDILCLDLSDNQTYLFPVADIGHANTADSPPGTQLIARASYMLKLPPEPLPLSSPPALRRVERLRFDLVLRDGKERRPTLSELSFNAGNGRFWGDVVLLESSLLSHQSTTNASGEAALKSAQLFRAMRDEKHNKTALDGSPDTVTLAALLAPVDEAAATFLPLGMPAILDEEELVGPAVADVGRDDLDVFNPSLFVDSYLVPNLSVQTTSGEALMKEAFDRYYIQDRRLRGMHSLMFTDEAALIAVPDAVHRGWRLTPPPPVLSPPLSSPPVTSPPVLPDHSLFMDCDAPEPAPPPPVVVPPAPTASPLPVLMSVEEFDFKPLLQIQQAALNFCQARREVLAVLTLPHHLEKRHCIEWLEKFRQQLGLPTRRNLSNDAQDISDLSYTAVYHPWLLLPDAGMPDNLRATPSDGAMCGVIAARERQRQVWIAPANVPLKDVLGLAPSFNAEEGAELFELQFNLIRHEPRDFRVMSAHTLSDESIWLQVSVRRLLILLRKLAVERGMDFVFENNDPRFRDGVRLKLEEILRFMFERGAFAGATPEQAYLVVTDSSVNTPESIDAGRFIAQIQVAPSQPMEFITVLLTRIGENLLQATEA